MFGIWPFRYKTKIKCNVRYMVVHILLSYRKSYSVTEMLIEPRPDTTIGE